MTLREVGSTLERLEAATLTQLAAELGASPREVEALLEFWERRGDVRRCSLLASSACGTSCRACPIGSSRSGEAEANRHVSGDGGTTVYEWVRANPKPRDSPSTRV